MWRCSTIFSPVQVCGHCRVDGLDLWTGALEWNLKTTSVFPHCSVVVKPICDPPLYSVMSTQYTSVYLGQCVKVFSHLVPFSKCLWTPCVFLSSVNTPKELRPLKRASEANRTDQIERWSEFSSLEILGSVPFSKAMWTQSSPGLLVIISAPHTRLLQQRFPWHNPSHWCHEKMNMCRFAEKNVCCFWILISDCQGCTDL